MSRPRFKSKEERLAQFKNYIYFTDIKAMFDAWKEMSDEERDFVKQDWDKRNAEVRAQRERDEDVH